MKVLVVTNLYPPTVIGGYEMSCAQMVEGLRQRGHDVRVLTSVPRALPEGEDRVLRSMRYPDVFQASDRPLVRSNFWELESNLLDAGNVYALISALRTFRPDVCYLWNLIGVGGAGLLGALECLGLPWLWHLGDTVPPYLCIFEGKILPLAREMSTRLTGRYVAVSQGLVHSIERVVQLGERVRLVPNWVMASEGAPARGYFSEGVLRIAFVGRVEEEKGIFILLDALRKVREAGADNFMLDVIGSGQTDEVRRLAASYGLDRQVQLKGWMPQQTVRRELRAHDLLAFPTFAKEAFGLAAFEAAAEGCVPLVSSPSGAAEWLVDGVDSLKAPREAGAFADVVLRACRREVDLQAIGRRAAAVVRRDFALSRIAPMIEEELRAVARPYAPVRDESSVYTIAVIGEAIARSAIASGTPGWRRDGG